MSGRPAASEAPGNDYQVPSLELIRPITNITNDNILSFEDEVFDIADHVGNTAENREAFRGVQFTEVDNPQITLMSAEELARYYEYSRMELTRGNIGVFKTVVKRYAPEVFNQTIEIPTFPASIYRFSPDRRLPNFNVAFVALGASEKSMEESRVLQSMAAFTLYQTFDRESPAPEAWNFNEVSRRLVLARVKGEEQKVDAALKIINIALARTSVIPEVLEAGPLKRERSSVARKRPLP